MPKNKGGRGSCCRAHDRAVRAVGAPRAPGGPRQLAQGLPGPQAPRCGRQRARPAATMQISRWYRCRAGRRSQIAAQGASTGWARPAGRSCSEQAARGGRRPAPPLAAAACGSRARRLPAGQCVLRPAPPSCVAPQWFQCHLARFVCPQARAARTAAGARTTATTSGS